MNSFPCLKLDTSGTTELQMNMFLSLRRTTSYMYVDLGRWFMSKNM